MLRRNFLGALLASFASVSSPTAWAQVDRGVAVVVQQAVQKHLRKIEQEGDELDFAIKWAEVNPKLPANLLELFAQHLRFHYHSSALTSSSLSNKDYEWYLDDFFGEGVLSSLWRYIQLPRGIPENSVLMGYLMRVIFMPQSSLHNLSVEGLLSSGEMQGLSERDASRLAKMFNQLDLPTHLTSISEWQRIVLTKQVTTWDNILNSKKGKIPYHQSFYYHFETLAYILKELQKERLNSEAVLSFDERWSERLKRFERIPILPKEVREQVGDVVLEQTKRAIYQYVVSKETELKLPQEMLAYLNS